MTTGVSVLGVEHRWGCPNCGATDVTFDPRPHSRFHACRGLKGLTAPFVPAGTRCKVEAVGREDYLNGDIPQRDGDGQVVMAVRTTRDDGEDIAILAACGTGRAGDAL